MVLGYKMIDLDVGSIHGVRWDIEKEGIQSKIVKTERQTNPLRMDHQIPVMHRWQNWGRNTTIVNNR